MFTVQMLSKPNESGIRQVQTVDAEWDYCDGRLNWNRAFSFLPLWNDAQVWIRADKHGNVVISYGRR